MGPTITRVVAGVGAFVGVVGAAVQLEQGTEPTTTAIEGVTAQPVPTPGTAAPGSSTGTSTESGTQTSPQPSPRPSPVPLPLPPDPRGRQSVALDANTIIAALSKGHLARVDEAIRGRRPVISLMAASEYLNGVLNHGSDPSLLLDFLIQRGVIFSPNASDVETIQLQADAHEAGHTNLATRWLDAVIAATARRDGIPLLTNDIRMQNALTALNMQWEPY